MNESTLSKEEAATTSESKLGFKYLKVHYENICYRFNNVILYHRKHQFGKYASLF